MATKKLKRFSALNHCSSDAKLTTIKAPLTIPHSP